MTVERTRQLALLQRDGMGPWKTPFNRTADNLANNGRSEDILPLLLPDPSSRLPANRLFFQINNGLCDYHGQTYLYDMFAAGEFLTWPPPLERIIPQESKTEILTQIFEDRVTTQGKLNSNFLVDLERIRLAHENGDASSGEAITVLHNVARDGGRIAFVAAHGGGKDWRVENGVRMEFADRIIHDLATRRDEGGNLRYNAVYLNSCNQDGSSVHIDSSVPVIAHKGLNGGIVLDGAKVYW